MVVGGSCDDDGAMRWPLKAKMGSDGMVTVVVGGDEKEDD